MAAPCSTVISCLQEIGITAARIARGIRSDSVLLKRLTEEKQISDFKTLADVLIQEMARYKIEERFPILKGHVYGEENGKLCTNGEDVNIVFGKNKDKTRQALNNLLNNDTTVTEALINLMHNETTQHFDQTAENLTQNLDFNIDLSRLGVWIDPIDGTNVYINPKERVADAKFSRNSLQNVTILIGLFDESSGHPVIGYINQPFHVQESQRWCGRTLWAVNFANHCHVSSSIGPVLVEEQALETVLCTNNITHYCTLPTNVKVIPAAGAGYKGLCVILGDADLFIGRGNYMWDTCGVQAILSCLGGDVLDFAKLRKVKEDVLKSTDPSRAQELIKQCRIHYIPKDMASDDLQLYMNQMTVCYRRINVLLEFLHYMK